MIGIRDILQNQKSDVSLDRLDEVLKIVKNTGNKENERKNIILKASYLMGGLAWSQPFSGSNKRTAVLITSTFLHNNGLALTIPKMRNMS